MATGNGRVVLTDLEPIPPLSADPENRERSLRSSLLKRSVVCICGLSLLYHLSSRCVETILDDEVAAARFDRQTLESGEPVYIARRPIDTSEYARAVADIEFSVSLMQDAFKGYIRGLKDLDEQPEDVRRHTKRTLSSVMQALIKSECVPSYFADVRFNHTAIVLMLRQIVRGDRESVKALLRAPHLVLLQPEIRFFKTRQEELLKSHRGQFALVKNQVIVETFSTWDEAYRVGVEQFGGEPFLVREVAEEGFLAAAAGFTRELGRGNA